MVDTRSVSDDDRRAGISFCFADGLQTLCLVGSHGNLCHVHVTVSGSNHTQVFFAYALTGSGKLGNGTERGCLGRLATGVGIYFGIQYEDIDIFTRSDDVVQTTVADVVRSTVATDNPLAAFYQIVCQFGQFGASRATGSLACLDHRDEFSGSGLAGICVVLAFEPFLSGSLEVGRSLIGCNGTLEEFFDTCTHLLVGQCHTETEFAEVLEQGVCPCRTLTLGVGRIRSRRNGTGVDGRATGGVGNDFTVAEQLGNQFHIRSFTATGTGA